MYTTSDALATLNRYLDITDADKEIIDRTSKRGFVLNVENQRIVIFVYPLVHKQDNTKNYFDTRDSGASERAVAWNYALQNNLRYFCLGVNDSVDKYTDYIFSLECNERKIEEISGTRNGVRSGPGNQIIIRNDFIPNQPFERIQNRLGIFISAIHKDSLRTYLINYDNRPYLLDNELINLDVQEEETVTEEEEEASNILYYGVPGSGKSHEIKRRYGNDPAFIERVVFHPDYTYSDFVGQILPKTDKITGHINYPFKAGPFTRILQNAVKDPKNKYYLIIEEINRGNAPAIFGEVFQLLDRVNGESEYGISNADIADYVYGDEKKQVKIPSNLFIIATMNTSDQNVFTLDTAFKRRWKMRIIENDLSACSFKNELICGTQYSWKGFAETINDLIIEVGEGNIGSEDHRLGAYFVKREELADRNAFAEKVLMYLWNDAFKYDHDKVFKSDYKTLEQLIKGFKENLFSIFLDTLNFPVAIGAAQTQQGENTSTVANPILTRDTIEEHGEGTETVNNGTNNNR